MALTMPWGMVGLVLLVAGFEVICEAKKKHKGKVKEVALEAHGEVLTDPQHGSQPSKPSSNPTTPAPNARNQQDDRDPAQTLFHEKAKKTNCIASIQQELRQLDAMIQLQQNRMLLLAKMRERLALDHATESPQHPQYPHQLDGVLQSIQNEQQDLFLGSQHRQHQQQLLFDNYFVRRLDLATTSRVVDVKTVAFMDGKSPQNMLLLAQNDGLLSFVLPTTMEMVSVATKQHGIVAVHDDLDNPDGARLVVVDSQQQVVVYHFGLVKRKRLVLGRNGTFTSMAMADAVFAPGTPLEISLFLQRDLTFVLDERPQALYLINRMKKSLMAVAFESGRMGFYNPNGTMVHQITTGAAPHLIVQQQGVLAFPNGTQSVVYVLAAKKDQSPEFVTCEGSNSNVTSLAFDTGRSSVLFAATSSGEILVFRLEFDQIQQNGYESVSTVCRLLFRSVPTSRQEAEPLDVVVSKGYLMAASSAHVAVYNTSWGPGRSMSLQKLFSSWTSLLPEQEDLSSSSCSIDSKALSGARLALFGSVLPSSSSTFSSSMLAYVTSTSCASSRVQIYQNLLPYHETSYGFEWLFSNATVAMALIVGIVIYQLLFRKNSSDSSSPSSTSPLERRLEEFKSLHKRRRQTDPFEIDDNMMGFRSQRDRQVFQDYQRFEKQRDPLEPQQQQHRMADSYCVDEITGLSASLKRRIQHAQHRGQDDDPSSALEEDDAELDEEELEDDD